MGFGIETTDETALGWVFYSSEDEVVAMDKATTPPAAGRAGSRGSSASDRPIDTKSAPTVLTREEDELLLAQLKGTPRLGHKDLKTT